MTCVEVSPSVSELRTAGEAINTRLRRNSGGSIVDLAGTIIGTLLVAVAIFSLSKAEIPATSYWKLSASSATWLLISGMVVFSFSSYAGSLRVTNFLYAKSSKLLRPYEVCITSDALLVRSAGIEASLAWSLVEDVVANDELLLVFTSPKDAVMVPCRAFASALEFESFVSSITEHVRKSEA